ncbi:MAG: hypothetical protein LKG56_11050 [Lachnospiraceae bacterium]|nr:hypothetical protein [Lachnospiraceae bacterium]MCH4031942.1 hypothetical protein [Lachnospiraceae bacterium]MCH4070565.1 hypothetical protein [Lachnospiraceae bacterium]MCH4109233.1 hypothetical protein [Lachnospiraceae bacterium]MCI1303206.1 hypothetical protein [Lachnospiraceae bacterium]
MITSSIIPPMIADVNDYEASRSGKYIPGMVGTLFYYGLELIGAACNIVAMKFYDLTPEKMKEVEMTVDEMRRE